MRLSAYDKVNLIAAYHFLVGGLYLIAAGAVVLLPVAAVLLQESEFLASLPGWFLGLNILVIAGGITIIALINLLLGWGLWQLRSWARMGAMIAAIFRIPFVPIGTVAGGIILYVLLQDETRDLFPAPPVPPELPQPLFRLALFCDVHGNPIALDAVLNDIEAQGGVDETWVLGDLVAIGHDPVGTLQRLAAVPRVHFVRGNTDRYVVTGERPGPSPADVLQDPSHFAQPLRIEASLSWTEAMVASVGWLDWLASLPLEQRLVLPDGTRVLGVHASPGTDDGDGIHPGLSDAELRQLTAGCEADLVFVGHTHLPLDRTVNGMRVVNLGSVSNPKTTDLQACYTLLEAYETGYRLSHHRVPYNLRAVIREVKRSSHPSAEYIISYFKGKQRLAWEEA